MRTYTIIAVPERGPSKPLLSTTNPYAAARKYAVECRRAARAATRKRNPSFTTVTLNYAGDSPVLQRAGWNPNTFTPAARRKRDGALAAALS